MLFILVKEEPKDLRVFKTKQIIRSESSEYPVLYMWAEVSRQYLCTRPQDRHKHNFCSGLFLSYIFLWFKFNIVETCEGSSYILPLTLSNMLFVLCFPFYDFISDSVKNSKGRVLVHCQAGISRSATICLAYLISRYRLRLDEAYEYVKKRRSVISPNFNFMGQLLNWETETQLTDRAVSSTELLINTPTTSCAVTSPFGFFSFSSLPCGSAITPSGNTQNSPGLVTSPM